MVEEQLLIGAGEIARYLRRSVPWVRSRIPAWKKHGFVRRELFGSPPKRIVRVVAFPSEIIKALKLGLK